ncbi:MAG: hypothetical protein AAF773_03455 [Cyanobacteria bacterium P01_D01_bin.115]
MRRVGSIALQLSDGVWQEELSLRIVVEFLSPSTEREDLGWFYQVRDRGLTPLPSNTHCSPSA